jgi:two-component system cell cycle sensor histidine kinase/response regulator CckA
MKKTGKILVVDDDRELLKFLREHLKGSEFKARFAAGGAEALKIASAGDIELLLTDVMLPDINGIDLARTMRKRQPGLKVAFMSGYLRPALTDLDDPEAPPKTFLQKPFSGKSLRCFLRDCRDGEE